MMAPAAMKKGIAMREVDSQLAIIFWATTAIEMKGSAIK